MEEDFAKRLKRLREEKGYTQSELSEIADMTTKSISNYEQSVSLNPAVEYLF